jgi:DNA polymerase III epsilon subunit-like protein
VVDTETTGLDPTRDQILSIGALDFGNPYRTYYNECRLSRRVNLSKSASGVTGFSLSMVRDRRKPTLEIILQEFLRWTSECKDKTLAGENPWFDIIFLKRAVARHGLAWPFGHRYVDLHSAIYVEMLRRRRRAMLSDGVSRLGLDRTLGYVGLRPRKGFHNALEDAKLEAEAFARLIYGKALLKEYSIQPIPNYLRRY